jgi:hypothetical protein
MFGWGDLGFLPGLALLLIGVVLRRAAAQQQSESDEVEEAPPARALNTDRIVSQPLPTRPVLHRPEPPLVEPPSGRRDEPVSQIFRSMERAADAEPETPTPDIESSTPSPRPMSSDELIAQARRRWSTET